MSTDYIFILAAAAFLAGISMFFGKSRSIALVLAIYIGVLAYGAFPWAASLVPAGASTTFATSFGYALLGVFVSVAYLAIAPAIWEGFEESMFGNVLPNVLLGFGLASLLLLIAGFLIPIAPLYSLPATIQEFLRTENISFWLLLPPLVAVFIAGRR